MKRKKSAKNPRREVLIRNQWITVWRERLKLPNGSTIPDYYFTKRPNMVIVVPLAENKKVVMLRQWRPVPKSYIYNLPMGLMDKKNESAMNAGRRELKEETGYSVKKLISLGVYWRAPAYLTSKVHIFLALCETLPHRSFQNKDRYELAVPKIMSLREAKQRTTDLGSLAALLLAEKFIKEHLI